LAPLDPSFPFSLLDTLKFPSESNPRYTVWPPESNFINCMFPLKFPSTILLEIGLPHQEEGKWLECIFSLPWLMRSFQVNPPEELEL
jgi:hypothetical protein